MSGRWDHRDPGAQPERTRLAWRRTTLTFTVVVVLAARRLVVSGVTPGAVALVALALDALLWVGFLVLAHQRMRRLTWLRPPPVAGATVLGAAGVIVVTALLAGVVLSAPG